MTTSTTHHGIIVAVDGSPASNVAVEWAAREAALRKESLTLVHVLPAPLITMWPEPLRTRAHQREFYERHGHQIIDDAVAVAEQSGVHLASFEHRTFSGNTLPTLIDLSKDAAMVVVGCRGRDDDDRPILGSIPTGLIRHAHCPVAIVHDEVQPLATAPVLVGVDGSPTSDQATAIAFDEASRRQVGLIAMHSWGEYGPYQVPMIDWEEQLGEGKAALAEHLAVWEQRYPNVAVERRLVYGEPAYQLLAASEAAQLTIVGSHGRGGFAGMLLGSVSSAVVQAVRTPVIVAREP
ncbi:universal stress protein [Mycobacterium antarcticum]|uniref:universal stress protein n=1 Tax=unclassified Mycolicibacterium TaxID=2636767 RepID=UPI0023A491F9|nr:MULTISPECIES: universal stress protein [unclassified Mycolicibacterium]GLP76775.1 universal stress protein [Mycolicibacterium sp. TUM20983]GLP82787.1 universal stress protein [Mycolicibacterium sp. TUM20984]